MAGDVRRWWRTTFAFMDVEFHGSVNLGSALSRGLWFSSALILVGSLVLSRSTPHQPTVTIAFLGDVMLGRGVALSHIETRPGWNPWQATFGQLMPLLTEADFAVANLESPLSDTLAYDQIIQNNSDLPYSYNLCAPAKSIVALSAAGIDLLSLANNHRWDCEEREKPQTEELLKEAGMKVIGTPELVSHTEFIRGIGFTFIAFDDVTNSINAEEASEAIKQAHCSGKFIIVSVHWGSEYQPGPDLRQQMLAQVFADSGASVVWGHHPHVLQRIVWIGEQSSMSPTGLRQLMSPTLVFYSLGNAIFDQTIPPDVTRSALLLVTFSEGGIQSIQAIPFEVIGRWGTIKLAGVDSAAKIWHRLELLKAVY